jgi:ribosomal protein S18 acetylase RimI-like enzyme
MRRLTAAEHAQGIEALALSFDADPMFVALFGEERERRQRWLRFTMAAMLALVGPDEHVFTTDDGVQGVIGLTPPGKYPPSQLRLLSFLAAFWKRPSMPMPTRALQKNGFAVLGAMEKLHHREDHLYVLVLGVHPDQKGRGFGRQLLAPSLELADRAGVPAYLETTNPANLGLYRRFGFEVVEEVRAWEGAPPLWTMLRPRA